MSIKPEVVRLDPGLKMSPWEPLEPVGERVDGMHPMERHHRVHEAITTTPCTVRAGVWEAQAYCERVEAYPYDEIVFVVEGSISIIDDHGKEELFAPGDCFFLPRGFSGYWKQHERLKIFHLTVAPEP